MKATTNSFPEFNIPVTVAKEFTGNVTPLLHEIRHAIQALLDKGQITTIDLRSMPLAPGEEAHIDTLLGEGEVRVELNTLGRSDIVETRFAGVWLITHFNTEGVILGKHIEISFIPVILKAQQRDIEAGLNQLNSELQTEPANAFGENSENNNDAI